MTISDLIKHLTKLDPDSIILVPKQNSDLKFNRYVAPNIYKDILTATNKGITDEYGVSGYKVKVVVIG